MGRGASIRRTSTPGRLGSDLGAILRTARGSRSRASLAAEAGVSAATLAEVELGRANPTLAYLEDLGPIYGVELELVAREARS